MIWAARLKKNMGPQQCRRDWAVKTFQRCQNNPPRKLRGYKGCHSKRRGSCRSSQLALLLIPHLTIHSQVHTSTDVTNMDAFGSAHTPLETPGRCRLHPRTSRRQPAAHTAFSVNHSSAWHTATQSSVIHLHLRPLAWDEWGGDRSVTLLGPRVWALLGSIRLPQSLARLFRLYFIQWHWANIHIHTHSPITVRYRWVKSDHRLGRFALKITITACRHQKK